MKLPYATIEDEGQIGEKSWAWPTRRFQWKRSCDKADDRIHVVMVAARVHKSLRDISRTKESSISAAVKVATNTMLVVKFVSCE